MIKIILGEKGNYLFSSVNGTLSFNKLSAEDEGEYVCEVTNNVGENLRKSIIISVLGKTRFLIVLMEYLK